MFMDYLKEILSFLTGMLAGWSLKFVIDKSSRNNKVEQKNINAGGDVVGRDKINK